MSQIKGLLKARRGVSFCLVAAMVAGMIPSVSAVSEQESTLRLSAMQEGPHYVGETVNVKVVSQDNAALYYTVDGTEPTESSLKVNDNIISVVGEEAGTVTVKVLAVVENKTVEEQPATPTTDEQEDVPTSEEDETEDLTSSDGENEQSAPAGENTPKGDENEAVAPDGNNSEPENGEDENDETQVIPSPSAPDSNEPENGEDESIPPSLSEDDSSKVETDGDEVDNTENNGNEGDGEEASEDKGKDTVEDSAPAGDSETTSSVTEIEANSEAENAGDSVAQENEKLPVFASLFPYSMSITPFSTVDSDTDADGIDTVVTPNANNEKQYYTASLDITFETANNIALTEDGTPEAPQLSFGENDKKIYGLTEAATVAVTLPTGIEKAYYTIDDTVPTIGSQVVRDGKITVNAPDEKDGGVVTVKVVSAIENEGDTIYSAPAEIDVSFYNTTKNEETSSISLAVDDGGTYYFENPASALLAGNDKNLQTGNITFSVMKDFSVAKFESDVDLFENMSHDVTLDIAGKTLTIRTEDESGITLGICSDSFTVTNSVGGVTGDMIGDPGCGNGNLYLEYCTIEAEKNTRLLAFKNIEVYATEGMVIKTPASAKKSECEIENSIIVHNSNSSPQTLSAYNLSLKKSKISGPGIPVSISGASSTSDDRSVIEDSSIIGKGSTAVYLSTYGKVTIKNGYFEGETYAVRAAGQKTSAVLEGGVYNGALSAEKSSSTIEIKGGYYKTDRFGDWKTEGTIQKEHLIEKAGSGEYEGYTQYVLRNQHLAEVELKVPTKGVASLNQEIGKNIAVYEGETIEYVITCLPDYAVKKIVYNNNEINLEGDENYKSDGLTSSYTLNVSGEFSLSIEVQYTGQKDDVVAKIGNNEYYSLTDAALALENGQTLNLKADINYPATLVFEESGATLDLEDHTLKVNAGEDDYGIRISSGSLTITGENKNKGKILFNGDFGISVEGRSELTLAGAALDSEGTSAVKIIECAGAGTVNIMEGYVRGCIVVGSGQLTSNLNISGGYLEAGIDGIAVNAKKAKVTITGGTIHSAKVGEGVYSDDSLSGVVYLATQSQNAEFFKMTGGEIISENKLSPIAFFYTALAGTYSISGDAKLTSTVGPAIIVHSVSSSNSAKLNIKDNALLTGATYAIEFIDDQSEMPEVNINGGRFKHGEGYIPINDTYYVTYPEGKVMDTEPENTNDYYTLEEKTELDGWYKPEVEGLDPIHYEYQDFEGLSDGTNSGLRQTLESAEKIYSEDAEATEARTHFNEVYAVAKRLYEKNRNANQSEINYWNTQLGDAILALQRETSVDVKNLADGTYYVDANFWKLSLAGYSMSNGAIVNEGEDRTTITVKDGKATMKLHFGPLLQYGLWGHLESFYIYQGDNVTTARSYIDREDEDGVRKEAQYSKWYKGSSASSGVTTAVSQGLSDEKTAEYNLPGVVEFELPYLGESDDMRQYVIGMDVDAMGTYVNALMIISWGTLQPAGELEDTLSVSETEVDLSLHENGTRSAEVTANVIGSSGWSISCTEKAEEDGTLAGAAEAKLDGNTITFTAKKVGTSTFVVKAEKDGAEALTKEIKVVVSDEAPVTPKPAVQGDKVETAISGTSLIGTTDKVVVTDKKVTIDAAAPGSSKVTEAEVTMEAASVAALKEAKKSVEIKTNVGTITMDVSSVAAAAASGEQVRLTMEEVEPPFIKGLDDEDFVTAYDLYLYYGKSEKSSLGGNVTVTVPWDKDVGYVYHVDGNQIQDKYTLNIGDGSASWTTEHFSTWALSIDRNLIDVGIAEGVYSVPIVIKQADAPSRDSMANDAVGEMVVADVSDDGVTYTMFLKARIGDEMGGDSLRGHLIKMWYYAPNDTKRTDPIPAEVVKTYEDRDMNGDIDTFPREVEVWQKGDPTEDFYIQVSVDAMGGDSNLQDALVKLDWDEAINDDGDAARGEFEDEYSIEKTIDSGDTVSRNKLKEWIEEDYIMVLQGDEDNLTARFDTEALEDIYYQADNSVKFVLEERKASKLNDKQKEVVGDRPVYELEITFGYDDDEIITEIEEGTVELTFPYKLQEDEGKDGLLIWLLDENGKFQKIKCSYSEKSKELNFETTKFGTFVIAYDAEQIWENPFTDVGEEDWFYDAVKYVVQNGLFSGTSETTFAPNLAMNRAMLVTVLYRLDGSPEVNGSSTYQDVAPDAYYMDAVLWATQNDIVSGYGNGIFGPENTVSREQMATILYRYAKFKGYNTSLVKTLDAFTDRGTVADYAIRAMQWAVATELLSGTSETTLSPKNGATRAQVATILMRFDEQVVTPAKEQAAAKVTEDTEADAKN